MIEFLAAVAVLTMQLALALGTLVGLFLATCFLLGWLVEVLRRMR